MIYKDDLKEEIHKEFLHATYRDEIERVVDRQQVVDAEPIVRCKDCKWFEEHFTGHLCGIDGDACGFYTTCDDPNGYCHIGEKMEDESTVKNRPCIRSIMVCKEDRMR